jgi:hypothetical protein
MKQIPGWLAGYAGLGHYRASQYPVGHSSDFVDPLINSWSVNMSLV